MSRMFLFRSRSAEAAGVTVKATSPPDAVDQIRGRVRTIARASLGGCGRG